VSRPEQPIDPRRPLANFAGGLRAMRRERRITYREMAKIAFCSHSVLSAAADGRALPTWQVTKAYVLACGGPLPYWEAFWREERNRARLRKGTSRGNYGDGPGGTTAAVDVKRPSSGQDP
jgi:hypothetical protein